MVHSYQAHKKGCPKTRFCRTSVLPKRGNSSLVFEKVGVHSDLTIHMITSLETLVTNLMKNIWMSLVWSLFYDVLSCIRLFLVYHFMLSFLAVIVRCVLLFVIRRIFCVYAFVYVCAYACVCPSLTTTCE